MEALNRETVLVEYADSFVIQNFSLIKTVSVQVGNKTFGIATKEKVMDNDVIREKNKVFQTLEENVKIKAKLSSCKSHKFFIRITFYVEPGQPEYVDSLESEYAPESFKQVS